jgi:rfaE bifunctional protein kinase chain/domain
MTLERLDEILGRFGDLAIAVVGDIFLDKYLVIDRRLSEISLETGKEAYQVVAIRHSPGGAGTVCNNLAALGLGALHPVSLVGEDGQGFDLRSDLTALGACLDYLPAWPGFYTPTYVKPMELHPDGSETEINRMDIKNRRPLDPAAEATVLDNLREVASQVNGIIVGDQVQERNHGLVTDRMREVLAELAAERPELVILVDSRVRVGEFRGVMLKPNQHEAVAAVTGEHSNRVDRAQALSAAQELTRRTGRPVFMTCGTDGIAVCTGADPALTPGVRLEGPLDIVGAGDSASAGLALGLCAGATPVEAAVLANLVASITVQQLGTTGTASPAQVRERFAEVAEQCTTF